MMSASEERKPFGSKLEHLKAVLMGDLGLTQKDLDEVWRRHEEGI